MKLNENQLEKGREAKLLSHPTPNICEVVFGRVKESADEKGEK